MRDVCFPDTAEELMLLRAAVQVGRIVLTPEGVKEVDKKTRRFGDWLNYGGMPEERTWSEMS